MDRRFKRYSQRSLKPLFWLYCYKGNEELRGERVIKAFNNLEFVGAEPAGHHKSHGHGDDMLLKIIKLKYSNGGSGPFKPYPEDK